MDRRNFLTTVGVAVGVTFIGNNAKASEKVEMVGILIDTTKCLGCRSCEYSCAEANKLAEPSDDTDELFKSFRKTSENSWTVVNKFEVDGNEIFVKEQCMHCAQPACAAACLTRAMHKTKEGPVVWDGSKCMGCRFCMISCPFDVPKFEYFSANPKISKCVMCWERLEKGELPACAENCPNEAIVFGKRSDLIHEANRRIYSESDSYVKHIYGEHEVGGTGVLYLSSVPFEKLKFRNDLGNDAYPELTKEFLYGVPVVLTLFPAFLLALSNSTKREKSLTESEGGNGH